MLHLLCEFKPCSWAGKTFSELEEQDQEILYATKIVIYEIRTKDDNEVRDLFIRLQGGTPLSAQDKRDAWPGKFTKYIIDMAGKEALNPEDGKAGKIGWQFFKEVIKTKKGSDKRKLAAQLVMIFIDQKSDKKKNFSSIKHENIDHFYHKNIDFDVNSDVVKDFKKVLEKLTKALEKRHKKLAGHEAIHLMLLVDLLMPDYVDGWEYHLADAHLEFKQRCKLASDAEKEDKGSEYDIYLTRYRNRVSTRSDEGSNIENRHEFFLGEMLKILQPYLTKRDKNRAFSDLERHKIYIRDRKKCQWCLKKESQHEVLWDEMEIHHVIPHHKGGQTDLSNGALMHKDCHPKGEKKETAFSQWWSIDKDKTRNTDKKDHKLKFKDIPNNTQCKFFFAGQQYLGKIEDKKLFVTRFKESFSSFSGASGHITGTSRNGWIDWEIQLPGENKWILAASWRKGR